MTNQVDTLELLRKHPHSTARELAEIIAPNEYHSTMVRVMANMTSNLNRLMKKGEVERSSRIPYIWWVTGETPYIVPTRDKDRKVEE